MMTRIEILRDVLKNGYRKIKVDGKRVTLDAFTASAMVQIYDRLTEENQAKYIALPWPKFLSVTWKLVGSK